MNLLERFFWRIGDLAERGVAALEALDPSKEPAPTPKPKRQSLRRAYRAIHPDQCPWCLGFDARTSDQRAAMGAWRHQHPRSQRTACKGWRRCRFVGPPAKRPEAAKAALDVTRKNSASFETVGALVNQLRIKDPASPIRVCAHIGGAIFEFEPGALFVSSTIGDVAIVGYGPRRKGE
jgi:hypothetical protein